MARIPASLPALAVATVLAAFAVAVPAAWAQSDLQTILNRIDRMQNELTTLQRDYYRAGAPAAPAGNGSSGGSLSPAALARFDARLAALEAQLRELTGRVEEQGFRNRQLQERMEKFASDTEFRLKQIEERAAPAAEAAAASPAAGQVAASPTATSPAAASQGAVNLRPPPAQLAGPPPANVNPDLAPRTLGQIRPGDVQAPPQQAAATPAAAISPKERYEAAYNILVAQDFERAEAAFKEFLQLHPGDALAGNAQYWLGETYYVRKDYQNAAVTFAEGYQKYAKSPKAPDNLLKLGMALAQLNRRQDACTAYSQLAAQFPNANAAIKKRANEERARLKCG
ncbi:MAG: tol-pal system protein YbgF [Thalassobaculales bacterium]